jgi:hypothetical protein
MYPDEDAPATAVPVPHGSSYSFVVVYVDPDEPVAQTRSAHGVGARG